MSADQQPIKSVLVIGRDIDAWLTALCLVRAFGQTGLKVSLLERPSTIGDSDVLHTLPTFAELHRQIGIDEPSLLRATKGVPVLGQRFSGWSGSGQPFLHAWDKQGAVLHNVDFLQCWLKAHADGMNVAIEEFSFGAVAAKQGKYLPPEKNSLEFSEAESGYHFNAQNYARALASLCVKQGVEVMRGDLAVVEASEGQIEGVRLADGTLAQADLYIDATGSSAEVIGTLAGDEFESWANWLPCNRMMTASAERLSPLPAFAEIKAFNGGWIGIYPLQDRAAVVAHYTTAVLEADDMLGMLPGLCGMQLSGDVIVSDLHSGYRTPWQGNCVAIGSAAAVLEGLDSARSHLLHTGIANLISMFPLNAAQMLEAVDYNRAVIGKAKNLRDFQIAHYHLNKRFDEQLWDLAREMPVPGTLRERLKLFQARGRVLPKDNETFQAENWISILLGHGLIPKSFDVRAGDIEPAEHMQFFQGLLRTIAGEVNSLSNLETYVELLSPRPTRSQLGGF